MQTSFPAIGTRGPAAATTMPTVRSGRRSPDRRCAQRASRWSFGPLLAPDGAQPRTMHPTALAADAVALKRVAGMPLPGVRA